MQTVPSNLLPDPAIPFDSLRIFSVGGTTTFFNWDGNTTAANTASGDWRDLSSWGSGSISYASKPLTITSSGGGRPEMNEHLKLLLMVSPLLLLQPSTTTLIIVTHLRVTINR